MSATCTEARLKEKIRIELGAPVLCVELTDEQLDHLIENVKRWFIAFVGGYPKVMQKTIDANQRVIQLGNDVEQVVEVAFEERVPFQLSFPELFGDSIPLTGVLNFGLAPLSSLRMDGALRQDQSGDVDLWPVSGLTQSLQYLEQISRVLSSDNDWEFQEHSKLLKIFPKRGRAQKILIFTLSNEFELNCLTAKECELIYMRLKMEAFDLVGMMRSKWSSFPVPGGERQLNYDILFEKARELREKTEELAHDLFAPHPFTLG